VIARDPSVRLRDIAGALGITERATQRIVSELVDEGFLTRRREGRRNTYIVHREKTMLTPQLSETEVGKLLEIFPAGAPTAQDLAATAS